MKDCMILAISGSLRMASLNSALLRAAARVAPAGVDVGIYAGLADMPLFNPDEECREPSPVRTLRARLNAADAVLIASPEYAHGVTGVLKNALDWMVGNESFVDKPVALLNASPRAVHAQASLRETLVTMSATIVDAACVTLPILGSGLGEVDMTENVGIRSTLIDALRALQRHVAERDA